VTASDPSIDFDCLPDVRRGPGRPRDPQLEERALQATLQVFGEKGWVGLTIEEVSARAHVGKSSIYLRWKDKETLLAAALRQTQLPHAYDAPDASSAHAVDVPEPPLREYLIAHASRRAELYLGPHGLAMLRLYVEARAFPDVFAEIRREAITDFVLEERHRVESAIRRGDLGPQASAVQILDAIEGSVLMHVLVTPPHLVDKVRRNLPDYIEKMVDNQLRAGTVSGPLSPPGS
jgi:AcrR family transcriptional regulator